MIHLTNKQANLLLQSVLGPEASPWRHGLQLMSCRSHFFPRGLCSTVEDAFAQMVTSSHRYSVYLSMLIHFMFVYTEIVCQTGQKKGNYEIWSWCCYCGDLVLGEMFNWQLWLGSLWSSFFCVIILQIKQHFVHRTSNLFSHDKKVMPPWPPPQQKGDRHWKKTCMTEFRLDNLKIIHFSPPFFPLPLCSSLSCECLSLM